MHSKQHPTKQLQTALEAYAATATGLDANPLSLDLWGLLVELGEECNRLFRDCGGEGEPFRENIDGFDVWCIMRCRQLESALAQGRRSCGGGVSDWLLLPHLRERVQAVVGEIKER